MAYTGPGDIKTFKAWGGLRAYSAATAGNNCADVCATAGGSTTTINTLANGNFDSSSAATVFGGNSGFNTKIFDQTGGGNHWTQATGANQPLMQLNVLQGSTLPELRLPGVGFTNIFNLGDAGTLSATNPWTLVLVVKLNSNGGARSMAGIGAAGASSQGLIYDSSGHVTLYYTAFTGTSFAAADGSYHRLIGINNSASSGLYIDGSANTFTGDTTAYGNGLSIGDNLGLYDINLLEWGLIQGTLTGTEAANLDANINNYWFVASAVQNYVFPDQMGNDPIICRQTIMVPDK